jgi:hypothetical protein
MLLAPVGARQWFLAKIQAQEKIGNLISEPISRLIRRSKYGQNTSCRDLSHLTIHREDSDYRSTLAAQNPGLKNQATERIREQE